MRWNPVCGRARDEGEMTDMKTWCGVFPATMVPFHDDFSIDEAGLTQHLNTLAAVPGINGVVVNGHTGEIMSLRPEERARITRIAAQTVGDKIKVVSGVSAEGSLEAIDHALAAKEAGADAILLMPPHHWLRFGRNSETAVGFIKDVAEGANINIIIHQYPAWTKAGYTLKEMLRMTEIPQVVSIKMGTRDMARQRFDYTALKQAAPRVSILTCHDEYLLASLLEGADGALVGFASYAPELIVALTEKALARDLVGAHAIRDRIDRLAHAIYQFGEPSSEAHQRMKMAALLTGRLSSAVVRPPLRPLAGEDVERMRKSLEAAGETVQLEAMALAGNGH